MNAETAYTHSTLDPCPNGQVLPEDIAPITYSPEICQLLRRCNYLQIHAASEQVLLQDFCTALTDNNLFSLAWIALTPAHQVEQLTVTAAAGSHSAQLTQQVALWNTAAEHPQKPLAIQELPKVQQPALLFSSDDAAAKTSLAVALKTDTQIFGLLVVYVDSPTGLQASEHSLICELAENLVYGIQTRRLQQAYQVAILEATQQTQKIERVLEDSLAAIAGVLEQRDPYTAGHQTRVAELAVKIGQEMQLNPQQLQALYLSGIVHDLGKIQIPAEILTKPSRLNAVEFALIKQHPETAYQILKNIDFPWPIAELCYQHHELLDGSGYPRQLRDGQILLEARILTVADIVESMSSDRPYRPALGIAKAMDEITLMAPSKLDPTVVSACIAILQRGDYVPNVLEVE